MVTSVYVRGVDNALWQLDWRDGRWHGWDRHDDGMVLASSPAIGSMRPDHEIVFVAGTDGSLWRKEWTSGTGWSGWGPLGTAGAGFVGDPVVICRNPGVCNVYVRGGDNALWQLAWCDGDRYWRRHDDGGVLAADPAVASTGPKHEMVFIVRADGDVWSKRFTAATGWSRWDSLGSPDGGISGGLCAISRHPTVVNLYAHGAGGAFWQRTYRDGGWHEWHRHTDGTALGSEPAGSTRGPNHELVLLRGLDAQLYATWWEPGLRTVDVNLIWVGVDRRPSGGEPVTSLAMTRWICFQAGLNVGAVNHFRIGSGQAGGLAIIDSLAEAEELSDRWAVRNGALNVFVVRSMNVADGWSTIGSERDATTVATTGVSSRNGSVADVDSGHSPIVYGWQGDSSRRAAAPATFGEPEPSATGVIRHQVAAIILGHARASASAVDSLDPAAFSELSAIAGGAAHPEYRVRAMSLLAEAKPKYGERIFRAALRDQSADVTVRAAAATWLSRFAAAEAQPALLAALESEQSAPVRHKIIAGLARVGEEDALLALSELVRSDPNVAVHAAFARSVIAHRVGVGGYEPPTAEESPLAPAPEGARTSRVLETHEVITSGTRLPDDTYGLIVGPGVAGLRCGGRRLAIAIDLTALARLLTTPTIAGLVATRVESDGALHTAMLILCWPATDTTAHVAIHRPNGTPAYVGSAKVTGTSVSFRLTAVRTPGARRGIISGTIASGILQELTVTSGPITPPQTPEAI
jgi:hypothetical protein